MLPLMNKCDATLTWELTGKTGLGWLLEENRDEKQIFYNFHIHGDGRFPFMSRVFHSLVFPLLPFFPTFSMLLVTLFLSSDLRSDDAF